MRQLDELTKMSLEHRPDTPDRRHYHPEPVTSFPAESAYSNTVSGRNNCNMLGENIRLAEESKRCLFMYGREKRNRWCSRLLSHIQGKLGIALLCAERRRAKAGCAQVCGPHPGRCTEDPATHKGRLYAGESSVPLCFGFVFMVLFVCCH